MAAHLVLPLESCDDPTLVGGKGAGLGRLIQSGFHVPPGLCVTIQAYRESLRAGGFDDAARWACLCQASDERRRALVEEDRRLVTSLALSRPLLALIDEELHRLGFGRETAFAVRSSASDEDGAKATFAGLYRTKLGVPREGFSQAILDCWASLWTEAALVYRLRVGGRSAAPAMAVIIQPMLAPRAAGVAYSRHPITGEPQQVWINAVFGLAEPLASGTVTPDQYVVGLGDGSGSGTVVERRLAGPEQGAPVLDEREILALAGLIKDVERRMGFPADIEWAMDGQGTWLLQVRPIPTPKPALPPLPIVWSRANFKETMPDVPSPLGLSFLEAFMETNIVSHYRELGCRVPDGWPTVRIMRGRPYINVSLFQSFTVQLGGDPRLVVEQMGGVERPSIEGPPRLPWWRILRAGLLMEKKIRRAAKRAPAWFIEMKQMAEDRPDEGKAGHQPADLLARLDRLNGRLREADLTFAIVAGVSQGLYALGLLLPRRLGPDWRPLLNDALQGIGTIISAAQILRLAELADKARQEPIAWEFLLADPWDPSAFRSNLAGTDFLREFDAYLAEYGHRAIGESDPMATRFAEMPDYLLGVIRSHLQAPPTEPGRSADAIRREQDIVRTNALERIRRAFGWRWHEWLLFRYTYIRLCRFLALREANRHHLMHFTAAARQGERRVGASFVALGLLQSKEDIFFLTADEIRAAVHDRRSNWKDVVATRRTERARHVLLDAPDTVIEGVGAAPREAVAHGETLTGIPLSSGYAEGPARIIRSPDDLKKIQRGDILVVPVIDPGMAPVLGLAAGLVVEMGGTLSHGAIIAREYGLPAVANVGLATRRLRDGDWMAVDASNGEVKTLGRSKDPAE
jgi:pyruvate,water dikinase